MMVSRRWWMAILAPLLAFIMLPSAAAAQDQVDAFVAREMAALKIPGLAIAVLQDGRPLKISTYGLADVELAVPVSQQALFQSASVGKPFTAAAIQLLARDGKLDLDDPVAKHVEAAPEAWSAITIRHLLTHSSGLGGYPQGFDLQRDYSESELIALISRQPLSFRPGHGSAYSNLGYVLLGAIIRAKTGKHHAAFLEERLYHPAGMTSAQTISEEDITPNRASGYRLYDGVLKNQVWVAPSLNATADGGPYVSILDMVRWEQALVANTVLSQDELRLAWTPFKLPTGQSTDYGLGWGLGWDAGQRTVEHGGQWQGFSSQITRYPDRGLTIILLANLARTPTWQLAYDLARIVDPGLTNGTASR